MASNSEVGRESFLIRVRPYQDESAPGYLLRLMQTNGFYGATNSHRYLANIVERRSSELWGMASSTSCFSKLAGALHIDPALLEMIAYSSCGSSRRRLRRVGHHWIPISAFCEASARFCPVCIAIKPYRRRIWDIEAAQACSEHGLLLQSSCFHCGASLSWHGTLIDECGHCGVWLGLAPKENAAENLIRLSVRIKLLLEAPTASAQQSLHTLLNAFTLVMLVQTGGGSVGRGSPAVGQKNESDLSDLIVNAASCVLDGPHAIRPLVESQLLQQVVDQPHIGSWPWEMAIRRSLKRYPFNGVEFVDWRAAIQDALSKRTTATAQLESWMAGSEATTCDLITFDELADWIGVSRKQIRTRECHRWLRRNKLLTEYLSETRVSVVGLTKLASKLLSRSRSQLADDDLITVQCFVRLGPSRWGISLWQVLDDAVQGELGELVWQRGHRVADLKLSRSRVLRLATKGEGARLYVTLADAARELQIYPDALRRAGKAGLISAKRVRCPDGYYRDSFGLSDWEKFTRTYVFGGELARLAGDDPRRFSEKIRDEGIEPVSGPGIDGGLVFIFKRHDVEKLDLKRVAEKRGYRTNCGRRDLKTAAKHKTKHERLGWMNSTEAAKYVGLSVQKMASAVRKKHLKAVVHRGSLGNRRFFRKRDLDAYMLNRL